MLVRITASCMVRDYLFFFGSFLYSMVFIGILLVLSPIAGLRAEVAPPLAMVSIPPAGGIRASAPA